MLPSRVAKESIKDLNFNILVANIGFEDENESLKKAQRQQKQRGRKR